MLYDDYYISNYWFFKVRTFFINDTTRLTLHTFYIILPKLLGVTGIYQAQPAADIFTLIICLVSIKPMKRIASNNMLPDNDIVK